MKIAALAVVASAVMMVSCAQRTAPLLARSYQQQARAWESADVKADVAAATGAGDFRFLCVTGEGVYAPGLPESQFTPGVAESAVDGTRFRVIDTTYDDINPALGDVIDQYKKAAHEYAEEYNRALTSSLRGQSDRAQPRRGAGK